jgi:hypothetical protein
MENVVQVYFTESRPGFGDFVLIESPYPSFGKLLEAVQDDEMVVCTLLRTVATGDQGCRRIVSRTPAAFRGDEVRRLQIPTWSFIEADAPARAA